MKSIAKKKVLAFTNEMKLLQKEINNSRLEKFIEDTEELIQHNEYGIALENLISNLYEFEIEINQNQLEIVKEALLEMKMNWDDWKFIEELVKD